MKRILITVFMLVPMVVFGGGRELENMLRQMVVAKITEKNPSAGQVLGVVLAPKTTINAGENGSYSNPTNQAAFLPEPKSARELVAYGKMLGNTGKWSNALACFVRANELEPDNIEGHYCAGVAYNRLGNKEAALAEYDVIKQIYATIGKKAEKLLVKIKGE